VSDAFPNRERCQAVRTDGAPCTAPVVRNGCCIGHQGDENAAWRAKGGAATSNAERAAKALPSTLRPVLGVLLSALAKVATKDYTPAQGGAMAALAGAIVRVFLAGEQEARLQELELSVAEWQRADRSRWPA
jgi:hypothetical protein